MIMEKTDLVKEKFSSLSESSFIPTFGERNNRQFNKIRGSHLFQRVASFLHLIDTILVSVRRLGVLISFREQLHSYQSNMSYVAYRISKVLISFREQLHSYFKRRFIGFRVENRRSHLFQRVASFLLLQHYYLVHS